MDPHAMLFPECDEVRDRHVARERHDLRGRNEVDEAFADPEFDLQTSGRAVRHRRRHPHEKVHRALLAEGKFVEARAHTAHQFSDERRTGGCLALGEENLEAVEIEFEAVDEIVVARERLKHRIEPELPHRRVGVIK